MTDLQRNEPLARAATWFLFLAAIVAIIVCFAIFHARDIADDFNHRSFLNVALIASIVLFSLLALTSSALGFLANCRPGRVAGSGAVVLLLLGWAVIWFSYYVAILHATPQ